VEHCTPTGYTAAHVELFRKWVLHSITKASKVNNSEVSDLHHCFNKSSINWVQYDTCTRWLHIKCAGLIRQAAVQCEKNTCFLANNGFFSIKLQGVNIHVCINQGITATSANLILNAHLFLAWTMPYVHAFASMLCVPIVFTYFVLALLPSLAIEIIFASTLFFYLAVECCAHLPRSSNVLISTVRTAAYLLSSPVRN